MSPAPTPPTAGPKETATATGTTDAPNRGNRYALNEDGNDIYVMQVAPQDSGMPEGTLITIPEAPRFGTVSEATKWIGASGEAYAGKQVTIIRAFEVMAVNVETNPRVVVSKKPKTKIAGPAATAAAK